MSTCDSCGEELRPDRNGWWVGADETSDCPKSDDGHTVDGYPRAKEPDEL